MDSSYKKMIVLPIVFVAPFTTICSTSLLESRRHVVPLSVPAMPGLVLGREHPRHSAWRDLEASSQSACLTTCKAEAPPLQLASALLGRGPCPLQRVSLSPWVSKELRGPQELGLQGTPRAAPPLPLRADNRSGSNYVLIAFFQAVSLEPRSSEFINK
jgi:hypothetical protein